MSETLSGGELESIWPEAEVRDEAIIDRNSILWRYGGDWRTGLTGLSAGVLQLMHPEVAAGVRQHSEFFNKPWERIFRSWPQIIGGVFDPDAEATAREIRDLHKDVKGTDEQGRNYHAFHPETFYWTHATFHNMIEDMIDKFTTHTMTAAERRQLYAQTTTWFERYDISTRVVPPSYDDFRQKWGFVCNNVLEMTPEAERAIGLAIDGRVNRLPIFDYL
ncbi:MAG TPA: oxygenase MpaB family protein, partial [Candidatus Saccharimonadales bacterium]|nr:oxygenase MpaB family protein [Candidatus Saccharimonadales bacterium]